MTQLPPLVSIRRMTRGALAALFLLLPLVGTSADKGAGTEHRKWVDGALPPVTSAARYPYQVQEIFITVRDGTQLGGRLLLPQGVPDGPWPCVLLADGYGHNTAIGTLVQPGLADLAERGYAGAHVSLRGSGNSGGVANLYNKFGEDGYDLVEWMARQPWCDGKVGMIGGSLLGISQMLTAKEAPPSLKAIVPYVACGNCYEYLWYPGGMLPGPGRVARGPAEYGTAILHRDYDEFWRSRTTIAPDHRKFAAHGIFALMMANFNDYISPASMKAFEEMAGERNMIIIGGDAHNVPMPEILPHSFLEYQAMWMDRFLRGLNKSFDKQPRALIYVQGVNQWRLENEWPIPDTHTAKLYLRGAPSGSATSLNDGSLLADEPGKNDGPSASVAYSPLTGPFLPTLRSASDGTYKGDLRPVQTNVLTWTTEALEVATEVTGRGKLTFWAEVGGTDADFVVPISDVAPDGTSTQVAVGYLNASHAHSRSDPVLPQPGKIQKYEMEIWPTSYVFQAGHRIRLNLAGGAKSGASGYLQGPGPSPYPALITIHQDHKHASVLELPIIGTSWRSLESRRGHHGEDDDD